MDSCTQLTTTPDVALRDPAEAVAAIEQNVSRTVRGELDSQVANSIAYQISVGVRAMECMVSAKVFRLEKLIVHLTGRRR